MVHTGPFCEGMSDRRIYGHASGGRRVNVLVLVLGVGFMNVRQEVQ